MVLHQGPLQRRRPCGAPRSADGYSLACSFLHCPSAAEGLGTSSSSAARAGVAPASASQATTSASAVASTVAAVLGAGSVSLSTNSGHSSIHLAGFAPGLQVQPLRRLMQVQGLGRPAGEQLGPWIIEEHWEGVPPSDLLAELLDRGVGSGHSPDHAEQHHHHEDNHVHDDDQLGNFATALLTSSTTVLLAMISAIFAVRLVREMMRPSTSPLVLGGPDPDVQGVQLQLDIPGVQPFRPFAGQGYRLQAEAPEEKQGGAATEGRPSAPPLGADAAQQ
eukprot:TRINITY_DN107429_c0_g1_i1.p1 TRINITY_DN107429_c0_g1~~TRINITY_DN107429_c0_g1_i1.p1  ORF type:complete len:277 (-),score=49.27 TRINITY_DN107429_c0_g1_i1:17-847(-)